MKQRLRTKLAVSVGMAAWLVVSAASAADMAPRRASVCREGVLTDAETGQPILDPTRKDPTPVRCGHVCRGGVLTDTETGQPILDPRKKDPTPIPCEEEANYWPLVGVGAVALGLGACAAAGCFDSHTPPWVPPPPLSP